MSSAIQFRLVGQVVALCTHWTNSLVMMLAMQNQELMKDPQIRTMTGLQSHYLTVWNIFFQILYFSVAFACDITTVAKMGYLIPQSVNKFRQIFFSSLVFPTTLVVVEVFWPLFLYDRSLIFPAFIDKIFSFKSNLVIHLSILFFVLWEIVFWPRSKPQSHLVALSILWTTFIAYVTLIFYTHALRGLFPYPIFSMLYGTAYFPLLLSGIFGLALINYYIQWKVTVFIWGSKKEQRGKSRRKAK